MTQEALKLALEALQFAYNHCDSDWVQDEKINPAITAIKEALAQPEQALTGQDIAALVTGMEVSIDVSTGDHDSGHRLFGVVDLVQQSQGSKHGLILLVQETKANFKEALAQTQEPVAWRVSPRYEDSDGYFDFTDLKDTADTLQKRGWTITPLYTTPPQRTWVGLTDEEIDDLWESTASYYNTHDFARAIEAKLKEKNT
jgi:hypothetical protein